MGKFATKFVSQKFFYYYNPTIHLYGKFPHLVSFCKLIPQMGPFWKNFRHGVVLYVVCMDFAWKTQASMASSWAQDTWMATRCCCWRFQVEERPAGEVGDFEPVLKSQLWLAISKATNVGCRGTEATEAISEALNEAAAAGSRQQDRRLGEFPKPPIGTAVCFA